MATLRAWMEGQPGRPPGDAGGEVDVAGAVVPGRLALLPAPPPMSYRQELGGGRRPPSSKAPGTAKRTRFPTSPARRVPENEPMIRTVRPPRAAGAGVAVEADRVHGRMHRTEPLGKHPRSKHPRWRPPWVRGRTRRKSPPLVPRNRPLDVPVAGPPGPPPRTRKGRPSSAPPEGARGGRRRPKSRIPRPVPSSKRKWPLRRRPSGPPAPDAFEASAVGAGSRTESFAGTPTRRC